MQKMTSELQSIDRGFEFRIFCWNVAGLRGRPDCAVVSHSARVHFIPAWQKGALRGKPLGEFFEAERCDVFCFQVWLCLATCHILRTGDSSEQLLGSRGAFGDGPWLRFIL